MRTLFTLAAFIAGTSGVFAQSLPPLPSVAETIDQASCSVFEKHGRFWEITGEPVSFGGMTLYNFAIGKGDIKTPIGDAWQLIETRCGCK